MSTNCNVSMSIYYSNKNGWHFTKIDLTHNHELKASTGIMSSKAELSEEILAFIKEQVITVRCTTSVLKRQLRHFKKIEIQDRLLYNLIAEYTREANGYGTAQECAILLENRLKHGPVAVKIDDCSQLELAVFVSEQSVHISTVGNFAFVEVINVDATHSTNRWGLYVVLITGIGPFGHSVHLGTFVLSDESLQSYQWCFLELERMVPGFLAGVRVMFTDGLPVYNDLVQATLFPHAHHARCL